MENKDESIDTTTEATTETQIEAPRAKKSKLLVTSEMKADPLSRKLLLFSMLFASLAILCIGFLTSIYLKKKHALKITHTEVVSTKQAPMITQALDEILVVLKSEQELRVEIVVECSTQDACNFIKDHSVQVRDLLIPMISNIDPIAFSAIDNKNLVRKNITERLNTLELQGKIIQIHFNNLSIEGNPK